MKFLNFKYINLKMPDCVAGGLKLNQRVKTQSIPDLEKNMLFLVDLEKYFFNFCYINLYGIFKILIILTLIFKF